MLLVVKAKKTMRRTPMNGRKNGKKQQRIRVLIGDDHTVVREGLLLLLEGRPDLVVVGEASNGREAVDLWKEHRPDVTLLDLRMPVLDGVGAIKQIREVDPNAHIVVLTTFDGDEDIYQAIKAGAKGLPVKRRDARSLNGLHSQSPYRRNLYSINPCGEARRSRQRRSFERA